MEPTFPFNPHDWTTITPLFVALSEAPVLPNGFTHWLAQWNALDIAVYDAWTHLKRRSYRDTKDIDAEHAYQIYTREVFSTYVELTHTLTTRALVLQPAAPSPAHQHLWRRWHNQAALFRPESLPIHAEISELESGYRELTRRIEPLPGNPIPHWMAHRADLNALMLRMLKLRRQLAHNSNLPNFLAYRWRELNRLGYEVESYQAFQRVVERVVVPAVAQLRAAGLVRPSAPEIDDVAALAAGIEQILKQVDPTFGEIFHTMRPDYLDLGQRPAKAITSEQWFFPAAGMPYLHTTSGNPGTMLHESGHAVHDYLSFQVHPSLWNFSGPEEFQEFAAVSMDLLSWPFYAQKHGGVYSEAECATARQNVLHLYLDVLVGCVMEDAFEHWVYGEAPDDVTPADFDQKWLELKQRFMPWDSDGATADEAMSGWQRWNWSLFRIPLYMIAYPIATVGACQLARLADLDRVSAIQNYKVALTLGNTRPLPELFGAAGLQFPFTDEAVEDSFQFILDQLTKPHSA